MSWYLIEMKLEFCLNQYSSFGEHIKSNLIKNKAKS